MSRIVKFSISVFAFAAQRFTRMVLSVLGVQRQPRCTVLYYHSVPAGYRDRFASQLDVIQRHTAPLHPEMLGSMAANRDYSLVTFDDGFENFLEVALPELQRRGIPSLMFIITQALGKSFGPRQQPEKVMTADQLRALPQDLVVLGSHTVTHPFLPESESADARFEISQSRVQLETLLNRTVSFFSFPFGGMTPELIAFCREAGYSRVFSTLPNSGFRPSDYCVGRVRVDPWDWPAEFRLKLAGAYDWLPNAIALKRTLLGNPISRWVPASRNLSKKGATRQSFIQN